MSAPNEQDVAAEVLTDPDVLDALRWLADRTAYAGRPLCPRCAKRPQDDTDEGWCVPCSSEHRADRHERIKAAKRRWWADNGSAWRKARKEGREWNPDDKGGDK